MNKFWRRFLEIKQPSDIIQLLDRIGMLPIELKNLIGVVQDKENHPEGDAYIHTLMVIDEAARIADRENLGHQDRLVLLFAALTHDLGKYTNTQIAEDGRITSYGHAEAGVEPAIEMLTAIGLPFEWIQEITPLIREHMAHIGYYMPDVTTRQVRRLMQRLQPTNIKMLAYLVEADMSGRGGQYFRQGLPQKFERILQMAEEIEIVEQDEVQPIITGNDLLALGFTEGPILGQIKEQVFEAQKRGEFSDQVGGYQWIVSRIIGGGI